MNCPNCGSQNSDSSKFCIHCGHALPVRTDAEHTAQESGTISEAERVSAPSEVVADRAGQTEDEVPAVSVSAAEAEVCENSAEKAAPGKSAEAIGNFEDNAEDVRSAEAEMCESFSGECPPASDVEITASADDPNDKQAFAAQNVSGNAEALPNGESAAPYKDAPAASYTAPSGSFSYTASVSAGAPDAPGSGNGAAAFAPPAYTAHAPNPYMKAESLRMAKLAALKAAVVSPSYLIAAIASTLVFLFIVCQPFIPGMSPLSSNTADLQKVLDSVEISFSLNSFAITASVIGALPSFLLALGMWLGFFSCRTKKNRVATAGFTIHQVLLCVALVFLCIFFLMLILSFAFIIIGIVSGAGVDITSELSPELRSMDSSLLSLIIYAVIFVSVAVMTLCTVWLARLIVTVSSVKAIARLRHQSTHIGLCGGNVHRRRNPYDHVGGRLLSPSDLLPRRFRNPQCSLSPLDRSVHLLAEAQGEYCGRRSRELLWRRVLRIRKRAERICRIRHRSGSACTPVQYSRSPARSSGGSCKNG